MSMEKLKTNNSICFPNVLNVLLIDGDSSSSPEIIRMIQGCGYKVTATSTASEALSIVGENRSEFDIVISDIDILDMDPFKFIEIIALKLDLLLIVMSANNDNNIRMKAIYSGACDYLTKPIQENDMQLLWKHVVHKRKQKEIEQYKMKINGVENRAIKMSSEVNFVSGIDNESYTSGETYKNDECNVKNEVSGKKPRMVWTGPLHEKFVAIVNELGIKNAVPKKILEMMNIKGLTRENVASHLQKYRMYMRKSEENMQQKAKMQAEAINRAILNSQMHGKNFRDHQASSSENTSKLWGQKRPNPVIPVCIRTQNQISTAIYGVHKASNAKYDVLVTKILSEPDQLSALDQFSDFNISDYYHDNRNLESSLLAQRPFKVQKISDYDPNADELYSCLNIPFSTIDDSALVASHFVEPELSLQNGANVYYDGGRVIDNTTNSGSEHIYLNPNLGLRGFSEGYNEQFDGHFDDRHTNVNSK